MCLRFTQQMIGNANVCFLLHEFAIFVCINCMLLLYDELTSEYNIRKYMFNVHGPFGWRGMAIFTNSRKTGMGARWHTSLVINWSCHRVIVIFVIVVVVEAAVVRSHISCLHMSSLFHYGCMSISFCSSLHQSSITISDDSHHFIIATSSTPHTHTNTIPHKEFVCIHTCVLFSRYFCFYYSLL